MKNYPAILRTVDRDFEKALKNLQSDPLFSSSQLTYTDDDKRRIALLWGAVVKPFLELRRILRSFMWRSFLFFGSKNAFVIKYATVNTYYNMVYELRSIFGPHEEFLRQYLDDTFPENYSTLARYVYHTRFYSILTYPREYFLTLRDEVDPILHPLFDRPEKSVSDLDKRWSLDFINVWYWFKYKITLVLTWISKHGGRLMMHIHLSSRRHGLISEKNVEKILLTMKPGDIILTRQNWGATNLNIPGFWKHMAMYIGTGAYLQKNHGDHEIVEKLEKNTHYIIEAIGIGVQIVPITVLTRHNDYLGVLRARFSGEKVRRAIEKTLPLVGREYDYSFNYYSDMNYVCSTLVTKAYLPEYNGDEGIDITLTRVATGITYPPNDLIKKFRDEHTSEKRQLDFVAFLDSREKDGSNFLATEEDLIMTADRPKLSFFLP